MIGRAEKSCPFRGEPPFQSTKKLRSSIVWRTTFAYIERIDGVVFPFEHPGHGSERTVRMNDRCCKSANLRWRIQHRV